jgi:NitT/TauT family transport system ATP-binding protein
MLELRECSAAYEGRAVLSPVCLTVHEGRTACVVGPSGCGKTTLLMIAAGLKKPASGVALFDGREVVPGDRAVGLILQQYGLFPWFTVGDNIELGLRIRGIPRGERRRIAAREIGRMGLAGSEAVFPRKLSGGQQQRVAIARAYALEPRLLLMDEPFSALDALSRESLQDLLLLSAAEQGTSILLVTHSIEEAVYLGHSICVLGDFPGRVIARFENPRRGSPGFRRDPEFFRLCADVRTAMESGRTTKWA